jgi:ABC-type Na+ efflux pump permease subunit
MEIKKMKSQINNEVLLLVFGFVLITAIATFVSFLTELLIIGQNELGVPYNIMTFTIPLIVLTFYVSLTIFLLKKAKNLPIVNSLNNKLPKTLFIVLTLIALIFPMINNMMSGDYMAYISGSQEGLQPDFFQLYALMNLWLYSSKWLIIIVLVIVYYKELKKEKN